MPGLKTVRPARYGVPCPPALPAQPPLCGGLPQQPPEFAAAVLPLAAVAAFQPVTPCDLLRIGKARLFTLTGAQSRPRLGAMPPALMPGHRRNENRCR